MFPLQSLITHIVLTLSASEELLKFGTDCKRSENNVANTRVVSRSEEGGGGGRCV